MRTVVLALVILCGTANASERVTFQTDDGLTIHGILSHADDALSTAPMVLLFHQAKSNADGEYGPIIRRLNTNGFHTLSIDQRSGGTLFGGTNRTVANLDKDDYGYCDVYPDLEAALDYVLGSGHEGPIVIWGSSYSAALAFQLAAKRAAEVDALLAFSPASSGPLAACPPADYLDEIRAPALALRPAKEFDIESVRSQMQEFEAAGVETFISHPGVHGSSMLVPERVGADTGETWSVVLRFLRASLR